MQGSRRTRSRGRALRLTLLAAFAVLALAMPATSTAVVYIEGQPSDQLPDFDSSAGLRLAPTAQQSAAARSINAAVTWSSYGTPSSIFNAKGYVATGIKAPTAAAAARKWVAANKVLFRLPSTASLELATSTTLRGTNRAHVVVFRQTFGGLSSDGSLSLSVVGPAKAGWKIAYVGGNLAGGTQLRGAQKLTPLAAWATAARFTGRGITRSQVTAFGRTASGATNVIATGFMGQQTVRPIAFPTAHGAVRAYRATVTKSITGNQSSYDVVVDATTGKLLSRQNTVFNLTDNPTWKAPEHSGPYNDLNAFPWNYPVTDNRAIFCWTPTAGCTSVKGDDPATNTYPSGVASKQPWDVQATVTGFTGTANTTWGNNVDDARVWSSADVHNSAAYGSPTLTRATSATRDYQPAFTDAWYVSGCNPANVNAAINPLGNDIEASTVSLFVGHNVMHDWAYYLGFDEAHWNAQQYNNGVVAPSPTPVPGGPVAAPVGNDGLLGNAQSGAASGSRDNANMGTGADGLHPTTNQFVWQPLAASFYAPCVDGAYDFSVFGHEYGHLIENRMIGKGVGARQGNAAGAMGEAFGDFDALAAFNELHLPIPPGADRYTEGAYATGNPYNGIRDFLAGRPMGGAFPKPGKNPDTDPVNYGDFGFDNVGPEVHADGEIWVAVQMDLRDLFLGRYPSPGEATDLDCAHGRIVPTACPGDRRWIQDYYDAMVMMPRNPTMTQARDAMLAADLARFGGVNQDLLWQGFAMRGFGQHTSTVSNADTNPVPDFSSPMADNGTLNFFADTGKGKDALPVNAKIYVGDYEARSTQIADTDPATVNAGTDATGNLDNTAQFAPTAPGPDSILPKGKDAKRWESYNFVAVAPGYGFVRFDVKHVKPGQSRDVTIHFEKNYASTTQGATITGDTLGTNTNLTSLIDDTESTNDTQSCAPTPCVVPVNGRWVVVALGTTKPVEIKQVAVSALLVPGNNRFTALRSFELYGCSTGNKDNPTCDGSIDTGWKRLVDSKDDAFPSVNPRPVTPDMTLRYFDVGAAGPPSTHVKLVVTANQCTGQPSYAGDQDLDPNNNADCPATSRGSEVHATELQVFSDKARVEIKPDDGA